MDASSYAVSKFDLRIPYAVATNDRALCLHHLGESAGQYSLKNSHIAVFREANHRQRIQRPSSHSIDVAQRIYGCDLPKSEGIVYDGRKEVNGLHQRQIVGELIHSGVIGCLEADQNVRVMLPG